MKSRQDGVQGVVVEQLSRMGDDPVLGIKEVLRNMLAIVGGELALYCRFDPERDEIRTCISVGLSEDLSYRGPLGSCFYYQEIVGAGRGHFLANDVKKNPALREDPFVERYGFKACFGSAVMFDERAAGAVVAFAKKRLDLSRQQLTTGRMSARLVALIADRERKMEKLRRQADNSSLVSAVAAEATSCSSSDFLKSTMAQIGKWAHTERITILWYDEPTRQFYTGIETSPAGQAGLVTADAIESLHALPIVNEVLLGKLALTSQNSDLLNSQLIKTLFPQKRPKRLLVMALHTARQVVGLCLISGGWSRQARCRDEMQTLKTVGSLIAYWREANVLRRQMNESQALIYQMVQLAPTGIFHFDPILRRLVKVNEEMLRFSGYSEEELLDLNVESLLTPDSRRLFQQRVSDLILGHPPANTVEYQIVTKNGKIEWVLLHLRYLYEGGRLVGVSAVLQPVTEHKQAMAKLDEYRRQLEALVEERTAQLRSVNKKLKSEITTHRRTARELERKTIHLEKLNTAMKVVLDKHNEDRLQDQENFQVNLRQLIEPYLDRLDASGLNPSQRQLLKVVRTNLNEVTITPMPEMAAKYYVFTPNELQVANLIKKGQSTKDISRILNLSQRTVESYRNTIRKKLGIKNRKINLRTYLSSAE